MKEEIQFIFLLFLSFTIGTLLTISITFIKHFIDPEPFLKHQTPPEIQCLRDLLSPKGAVLFFIFTLLIGLPISLFVLKHMNKV